jgi:hypothetical protein
MKSKHTTVTTTTTTAGTATTERKTVVRSSGPASMFERGNLLWMLAGAALMILGYVLMTGGASNDPNVFNESEVYSTRRITIAPILILAGLVVEIFALFRNNNNRKD